MSYIICDFFNVQQTKLIKYISTSTTLKVYVFKLGSKLFGESPHWESRGLLLIWLLSYIWASVVGGN